MQSKIEEIKAQVSAWVAESAEELEELRIKYLSKKGLLSELFDDFKLVPNDQKREIGKQLNELKTFVATELEELRQSFKKGEAGSEGEDLTRPGEPQRLGSRHPLALVKKEICSIFGRLGFVISEDREIEDDWHVFTALNFPEEHPARDMQDTFFVSQKDNILLRTHTSSVQVREMKDANPPFRAIFPGRVFRNEAISARAHCIFHQIEGLYVDENVSFADLKQTLLYFAKEYFGETTKIRLRPSYFPFTEPSAEMDVSCSLCGGKGCNVCKYTGWLEVLGCGMVDPNVLDACDIDSKKYTGFAFGMGIERIAMLKYRINDLRHFFENDVRFLNQVSNIF
ncbi:MAG: phenylalanine--tRNA ligase subunit alpha [Bacteroidales bacterium]